MTKRTEDKHHDVIDDGINNRDDDAADNTHKKGCLIDCPIKKKIVKLVEMK